MKRRFINASKKVLAIAMSTAMMMTSIVVSNPMEVNAANVIENATELECADWWTAHTGGYIVNETGVQITFDYDVYDDQTENWMAPVVVVYSSDNGKVEGGNYVEYEVIRSDLYAWVGGLNSGLAYNDWYAAGHRKYELFNPAWWTENSYNGGDFTWDNWRAAGIAGGVPASVIAVREGNYVEIQMDINGIPSVWQVPVPADKDVYVALTGQKCKLSNITSKEYSGDYANSVCWWAGRTKGYAVDDDGLTLTFDTKTNSTAVDTWETSSLLIFRSNGNLLAGGDLYEYGVIRADLEGWGSNNTPYSQVDNTTIDKVAFLAEHKAGTSATVNASIVDGKLVVEYENAGTKSTTTIDIDETQEVYIAVIGQNSVASNVKAVDNSEEIMEVLGAQVKQTDTTYSIGFVSTIDKTTFDTIKDDIVEMGVLMKNDVTATSLALLKGNVGDFVKKVTTSYVTDLSVLDSTQSDSSVYAFRSIVTGVSLLYKDFTAVPYVTYMDGEDEVTVYGDAISRCIHDCKVVN